MSRSLRTLSVLAHPSNFTRPLTRSRHSLLQSNGDLRIQQVRIKRDAPRGARRTFLQIAICTTIFHYAWRFVFDEEEETASKAGALLKTQKKISNEANDGATDDGEIEKGENQDEDEVQVPETMPEDALFIPLGKVRQLPDTHYKGSDPEWQSFVEFGQDRERRAAVRKELVELVQHIYTRTTTVQIHVGAPVKPGRVWLDILVPYGPPPEYEQSGLEITDDYIAWTTRPISASQVARLESALVPLPIVKSLWASCSTYCSLQLAKLQQVLKTTPASSDDSPQLPVATLPPLDPLQEEDSSEETQSRTQMDKMSDPKSDVGSTKGLAKSSSPDNSKLSRWLPPLPQPDSDIASAITEFKRTLAKNWHRPSPLGERGTFIVRGDIELTGPQASCVLEVVADYHPQEARYKSVGIGLKYFLPRRQRPRPPLESENAST